MLCKKPYMQGNLAYGCGQCMPCRYNRRRLWTHRIILESLVHQGSSFLTLTYADEFLPDNGSLEPRDLQLFMKRIRKNTGLKLRYYGVGEYGDVTERPHYHVALFGLDPSDAAHVAASWGLGHTMCGTLTFDSAAYVAGYVTKKMTGKDDIRLRGRYPEFARMSLRPGIGALAVDQIALALQNEHGWDEIDRTGDVPLSLRHGVRDYPLGSYLRKKLREAMNFEDTSTPQSVTHEISKEMCDMWANYQSKAEVAPISLKEVLIAVNKQKVRNMETRTKIFSKQRTL